MFELSSSSGEAPFTPEITNLSENADTFLWDFGDSSATTNASVPNHTYTTAGTFALTLTAEGGGQSSTFTQTVTVEAGPMAEVKLQPAQPAVSVTDSLQLSAQVFDQFGNQLTDVVLEWTTSEDSGIIDQSGLYIPPTMAGQYEQAVTVSASKAGQTQQASATVAVNPGAPAELVVEPAQVLLDIGGSQDMSLKVLDIYGNEVSNAPTLWKSDAKAGSIDSNGVFTAGTTAGSFRLGNRVEVVQGDTSLSETFEIFITPDPLASI
ncbi:MAG: PKD domain-containing protein, partial [Chloroflexi bacterium]|nr:PKD domain-containing protein [Chloroflexota bacterium]